MRFSEQIVTEIGRLLNGTNNPQHGAIGHLALAAGRATESLVYLADIDDNRFKNIWPIDCYNNDSIDDGHVRWAAATALTSLDLCMASASRLSGFAQRPPRGEDSIRDYYKVTNQGKIEDKRNLIISPWRSWVDAVVNDPRYETLLKVRNALIHADAFRIVHGTTGHLQGHSLRYGYNIGPLIPPVQNSTHLKITSREIIELSRDISLKHVGEFVTILKSLT